MPGPKPPEIALSDAERRELERLVCAQKTGQALVRRARVVLLAAIGYSNTDIAERVPMDVEAVGLWRRRWNDWRRTCRRDQAKWRVVSSSTSATAPVRFSSTSMWRL